MVFRDAPLLFAAAAETTEEIRDASFSLWERITDATPRLIAALTLVSIGYVVSRAVRFGLHRILRRHKTPSFARVMSKVAGWVLLTIIVLLAIAVTFPSIQPVDILAGLGFFSVAVGFAFQDILENTLAGMLLLFRQPFEAGDQIDVEGRVGTVEAITIRETQLRSFSGELIVIPNRDVYKNVLVIATHYPQRRQEFVVGIAYENDAGEATAVIAEALRSVEGVDAMPEPIAVVTQLGVSTVDIAALFWSDPRRLDGRRVLDRAIRSVKLALDEAGIEMPADIIALQATPSFKAAVQGDAEVTPAGSVTRPAPVAPSPAAEPPSAEPPSAEPPSAEPPSAEPPSAEPGAAPGAGFAAERTGAAPRADA